MKPSKYNVIRAYTAYNSDFSYGNHRSDYFRDLPIINQLGKSKLLVWCFSWNLFESFSKKEIIRKV